MTTANRGSNRSHLIQATRRALMVQVVAIVVAIMLASPDYIDRLVRPTICTFCLDLRGLAFVLWVVFFTPAVLVLTAVAWALRPGRIWPSWLALAVDLVVLGLIAYSVLLVATGHGGTSDYAPPLVQLLQAVLVFVPNLASLLLVVLLLNAAYGSSDGLLQLTRNVLFVQVLGMAACIALASPSLSDRLFNAYHSGTEGLAFALWTVVLAPAALVMLVAAWRLNRRMTWPVLLPVLANILLLAVLGFTGFVGFVRKLDPVQSGLEAVQILVLVLPALATMAMLGIFSLPPTKLGQPRSTAPGT
jgi:hypothetical protein